MAREGLRTLVVAKKTLSFEQYADFEVSFSFSFSLRSVKEKLIAFSVVDCCAY